MKPKFSLVIVMLLFALYINANAQNTFPSTGAAGIGTTAPNTSALLDIKSTTKGFLPPRLTTAQRNVIASPVKGLLVFQTDGIQGLYYYTGSSWLPVSAKPWNLTGNSNTDSSLDFIGTLDAHPLIFKVNKVCSGYISSSASNTSFGYQALVSNTSGKYNTATGYQTLKANISSYGTATGYQALYSNGSGYINTATGAQALYSNTTGGSNVATGVQSLYSNTTGSNNTAYGTYTLSSNKTGNSNTANGTYALYSTTGNDNVGIGYQAALLNTSGYSNVAIGTHALYNNTIGTNMVAIGDSALFNQVNSDRGYGNTAIGSKSLYSNTNGDGNSANGYKALYSNTGYQNSAFGYQALVNNINGNFNVANGYDALSKNTNGYGNTADGYEALNLNTTGNDNTAYGGFALSSNKTGTSNTAIGYVADVNLDGLTEATAIGSGATATASEQVMLGSTSVTSVVAAGSYTIFSDGRYKNNIQENVPGLEFIKQLRPVTYHYDIHGMNDKMGITAQRNKRANANINSAGNTVPDKAMEDAINAKEKKLYTGFIAQEVEAAAKKLNYDFSGVHHPENDKDLYGLSYGDFVVPLVKGEQELDSIQNEKFKIQTKEIDSLRSEIEELKTMIANLSKIDGQQSVVISSASLGQNIPNPFANATSISYTLPQSYSSAYLTLSDKKGVVLKQITLNTKGKGNILVDASTLSAGAYQYSLYVNNKLVDTKQMVAAR